MRAGYSALEKEDIQVELRDKFLIFLGPQLRKPSETLSPFWPAPLATSLADIENTRLAVATLYPFPNWKITPAE